MVKSKGESLWDIAIEEFQEASNSSAEDASSEERHILIVGNKDCGKTTIVLRFLDRDEAPKPTTALEYTFGRRAKGHNNVKDVGHIWELGGGASLARLVDIPLAADTIMETSLVVCLDLSSPNDMWMVAETLLASLKGRVEQCLTELARKDKKILERVKAAKKERLGGDHVDDDLIEPFDIPLVIVGTKYDLYQEMDPEKKKVIAKTLRFLAHNYGASLYFTSIKIDSSFAKLRGVLNALVFGTQINRTVQLDHGKPLVIPAGSDSLQNIGSPPLSDADIGKASAKSPVDLWKLAYTKYFPSNPIRSKQSEDPTKDVQFAEPVIDKIRLEKDQELERYRKASERRMKELERQVEQEQFSM